MPIVESHYRLRHAVSELILRHMRYDGRLAYQRRSRRRRAEDTHHARRALHYRRALHHDRF